MQYINIYKMKTKLYEETFMFVLVQAAVSKVQNHSAFISKLFQATKKMFTGIVINHEWLLMCMSTFLHVHVKVDTARACHISTWFSHLQQQSG